MAEAWAVVSIVSSIVQLVDFTTKVVSRLNEFRSDTDDVPKTLSHLKAELTLLLHTLKQINNAITAKTIPEASAPKLQPVLHNCEQLIMGLDKILTKTLPKEGSGKTKQFLKALRSVWKDGEIEQITKTLRGYIATLTFYLTAAHSTLQPLTGT